MGPMGPAGPPDPMGPSFAEAFYFLEVEDEHGGDGPAAAAGEEAGPRRISAGNICGGAHTAGMIGGGGVATPSPAS